jgi:hypothetical protein
MQVGCVNEPAIGSMMKSSCRLCATADEANAVTRAPAAHAIERNIESSTPLHGDSDEPRQVTRCSRAALRSEFATCGARETSNRSSDPGIVEVQPERGGRYDA